jgi:hypothetical protein
MRFPSTSTSATGAITPAGRGIGLVELITFGTQGIGAVGAMAIAFGVMVITRCADSDSVPDI